MANTMNQTAANAREMSPMERVLDQLQSRLRDMEETVCCMVNRLEPVMVSEVPSIELGKSDGRIPVPAPRALNSSFGYTVEECSDRVAQMNEGLGKLLHRLAI
jgi:hypothetical protein